MATISKAMSKYITKIKEHPRFETVKETSGKKSVQYGVLAVAAVLNAIASLLFKAINKELFDLIMFVIILIFLGSLVGSIMFMDRRDKKIREGIMKDFQSRYDKKLDEFTSICSRCSQSSQALLHEMKLTFDDKLKEKQEDMDVIIGGYRNSVDNAVNLYIRERLKTDQMIANMAGATTAYDKLRLFARGKTD